MGQAAGFLAAWTWRKAAPGQEFAMGTRAPVDNDLAALRAIGKPKRYFPGQLLFREGDSTDHVVLVTHGKVKISSVSKDGYEAVLAVRSAGDVIGEFSALDGRPRSASGYALGEVDTVILTGEQFREYLQTHPTATFLLLRRVIAHFREADRRRAEFGSNRVTERIATLLLDLADTYGSPVADGAGIAITVPLSQNELAGATGASREAVARSLRRLREAGAVVTQRRKITVLRSDLLRTFAASG
jgi:CRP/FNR family transcriptional regulator, cyclic AMP receptor protein